jgi:Secretion system C-terminal sorting domain
MNNSFRIIKSSRFFCVLFVFLVSLSILSAVDYYYVDVTGSDDGDGSEGDPWATIQYAVNNVATPADNDIVIYISAGIFNLWDGATTQTIIVNRAFHDLTLQGAGAEDTIIQGHSVQGLADGRVFYITGTWGDISIRDVTIRYGNSANGGGGIYTKEVWSLVLENCNIAYNHADDRGGGILNGYRGGLSLYYCTVHHNATDGDGGGISNYESVHVTYSPLLDIRNSTISHNTAANRGGGISARSNDFTNPGTRVHICNATISQNNSGGRGGGIYYGLYSSARLKNSIIGNNDSDSNEGDDVYFFPADEDMEDYGNNIIEYCDGYDFSGNGNFTGSQASLNLSATLELNSSSVGTYTLKTTLGSIAIDNGDDTPIPAWGVGYTRDQRNAPINEEIDIGAYEWWTDSGDFPVEPSDHVSDFTATAMYDVTIDLSWTENDGDNAADGYLILASTGGISTPADDTEPADDIDLTDGSGNVMVAHGTTTYTFDNCSSSTTYNFRIYPYTDSYDYINYKTDTGFGYDDVTTGKPEPTNHVTVFIVEHDPTNGLSQLNNQWTDAAGGQLPDAYLIKASDTGFGDITAPVDGTPKTDDTDFADGSGAVNIVHGSKGSYNWLSLNSGTTYYFKIYPYMNSGSLINYKIDGSVPSGSAETASNPAPGDLIITEIVGDGVDDMGMPNTGFIEFQNISSSVIDLNNVVARYYDNGAVTPTATLDLFGLIDPFQYKTICQEHGAFMMTYGFDADFQAPMDGMTSLFPLDGGEDSIELFFDLGKSDLIDQFNDPSDPWSWIDTEPLERNTTASGTSLSSWTENTGGSGSPGAGNDNPVPVSLSSFSAEFSDGTPVLHWTTQSETDNLGWNLYRSEDENGFENEDYSQINSIMIAGMGTTSIPTNYSFTDEYPNIEGHIYFYWLESVSTINELELFGPVSIEIPFAGQLPTMTILTNNYPNPFNPETTISFSIKENETGKLSIYNLKGENILKENFQTGNHQYHWNAESLASGIYFYKLSSPTTNITKKMILMK